MENPLDHFYSDLQEPQQSCFLALRDIIIRFDDRIMPAWKYKLPFFTINGKNLCYLWMDKKTKFPYIGFLKGNQLDHPDLYQGDRKLVKLLYVNPGEDINVQSIHEILTQAVQLY